ncbi:amino acid transporter [Parazoarcus communis]|uniref:Amino acid transporter n=1 Tax=Parazoarcus communis TaxID=41977 RepID=A0A2U8GP19_9RHOO|nr:LysE/ArgO family amino acid transporter [Parazoarcus communis]AWI74943.1 amino acid transporter [Parazoarcus communis]
MNAGFLNGFMLTLGLIMAIGAQNAHVLRQGLRGEHVLLTVVVSVLCDVSLILLGMNGLGAVFSANPDWMEAARYGGAAFLGWYGLRSLRSALAGGSLQADAGQRRRLTWRQALLTAAGFSLLNPHAYLDTVVLLGSIGNSQAAELRPLFTAGAIAGSVCWFVLLGYGARLLAPVFRRPRAWQVLDGGVALMLWSIAAWLILSA